MSFQEPLDEWLIGKPRDFVNRRVFLTAQAFARADASGGIVLLVAALAAMVWANTPWSDSYFDLWHTDIVFDAALFSIDMHLREWVNDGLMTLFFFLMGLEIKREISHGELSSKRRALLPAAAAFGGMAMPALIFTAFNHGGPGAQGWGVPMATDIAFALGVLSLLSRRIPFSVRIFLLALAIADDLGAILVIAFFYSHSLDLAALGIAGAVLAGIFVINRAGVRTINVYIALGVMLWVATLQSGIHATLAGVVLGLLTPARQFYNPSTFAEAANDLAGRYKLAVAAKAADVQESLLAQMEDLAKGTEAPIERLERKLARWVAFGIVPVFALANAGVAVSGDVIGDAAGSPVTQGVALGLVFGKPLGIFLFTFLAVRLNICDMPVGANWNHIFGVGLLGGIGFTVSLLITGLGFESGVLADQAKLGVLVASIIAGTLGLGYLRLTSRPALAKHGPHASHNKLENLVS